MSIVNPNDPPERQVEKLSRVVDALIRRSEEQVSQSNASHAHFQAAVVLEQQVRNRTRDLAEALEHLNTANAQLASAKEEADRARSDLGNAIEAVREGFALFDAEDRLVLKNDRFCAFLPDIAQSCEAGMLFDTYVNVVSSSRYLIFPPNLTLEEWRRQRVQAHHRRHVNFNIEIMGDRWFQVSEQRTHDNRTAIIQSDVTDIIRMERHERDKLIDDHALRIRATLDHLNQGVAMFDSKGRLIGANEKLRTILSPPVQLLRIGIGIETIIEYFRTVKLFENDGAVEQLETWVADTRAEPLKFSISTVDDMHFEFFCEKTPDGGFVISLSDVTSQRLAVKAIHALNETLETRVEERTSELAEAREKAERASESKSRFVAAVSHDLVQPLNAAKLFTASLSEMSLDQKPREIVERISNALFSVETILGAILDITKLDGDAETVDRTSFCISPILVALETEFRPMAEAKSLELVFGGSEDWVNSDAAYLRRVLQNLIANAIRYTEEGQVTIRTAVDMGTLRIEIADTGPGIPKERHGDIFKEFTRLNHSNNDTKQPGMGLGLAIVERACALLGHGLSFESTEGVGTTFRVEVPITKQGPVARRPSKPSEKGGAAALSGLVALIVEDDVEALAAMSGLLEKWNVHTIEAETGQQAIDLLSEVGIVPDIFLVDYRIGGEAAGFEIISRLRAWGGDVPAVMVTADHSAQVATDARSAGIEILQKPVEAHRLRSLLVWSQGQRLGQSA